MEHIFDTMRVTRNNILNTISGFSNEQLNRVPVGYSNNLVWNLGHVLVTQQLLVYRLSGQQGYIRDDFIDRFRKGTKPEGEVEQQEVNSIKLELLNMVDKTRKDWEAEKFKEYKEYPTSFGVTLHSTSDALQFNNSHEALHLGYMMAMKKMI